MRLPTLPHSGFPMQVSACVCSVPSSSPSIAGDTTVVLVARFVSLLDRQLLIRSLLNVTAMSPHAGRSHVRFELCTAVSALTMLVDVCMNVCMWLQVVCSVCSSNSVPLSYQEGKPGRVCTVCFDNYNIHLHRRGIVAALCCVCIDLCAHVCVRVVAICFAVSVLTCVRMFASVSWPYVLLCPLPFKANISFLHHHLRGNQCSP